MSIPILYLNLSERVDRKRFMQEQFSSLGLASTRISGVEPSELTEDLLGEYCDPAAAYVLSPPQLCCTLSHVKAWKQFLQTQAEQALILEDDAILSDNLPSFLEQVASLPYDLIKIEDPERKLLVQEPLPGVNIAGVALRRFRSTGWGAAGYIISKSAAQRLLTNPYLFRLPTDAALFCPLEQPGQSLDMVQTDPALCVQLKHHGPTIKSKTSRSNIRMFLLPTSWLGRTTRWKRHLRWAGIKVWEMLTRPDLSRQKIPFVQKWPTKPPSD